MGSNDRAASANTASDPPDGSLTPFRGLRHSWQPTDPRARERSIWGSWGAVKDVGAQTDLMRSVTRGLRKSERLIVILYYYE